MDDLRRLLRDMEVFAGELPVFDPLMTPDTPSELFTEWLLGARWRPGCANRTR